MNEFTSPEPQLNFSSVEQLRTYLGELPRELSFDEVDFVEKARWMLEYWEAGDDADKELDPRLKSVLSQAGPDWEDRYKNLSRKRLHKASLIADAIEISHFTLHGLGDKSREEKIEILEALMAHYGLETIEYVDLINRTVVNKRQSEVGIPGSITEIVQQVSDAEDQLRKAWATYFPNHQPRILKSDSDNPNNETLVFKATGAAGEDLIVDYSYDLAQGTTSITAWDGTAMVDKSPILTEMAKGESLVRINKLCLGTFQTEILSQQKALYDWFAVYQSSQMDRTEQGLKSFVGEGYQPEKDEYTIGSVHQEVNIGAQLEDFAVFLKGSEKLYSLFK